MNPDEDVCDVCGAEATYWQVPSRGDPTAMSRCPRHTPYEDDELRCHIAVARIVAEHWRNEAVRWPDNAWAAALLDHVRAALDGLTDPTAFGIDDGHPDAERIRQAVYCD